MPAGDIEINSRAYPGIKASVSVEKAIAIREAFFMPNGVPEEYSRAVLHTAFYWCAEVMGLRAIGSGFAGKGVFTEPEKLALEQFGQVVRLAAFIRCQPGGWSSPASDRSNLNELAARYLHLGAIDPGNVLRLENFPQLIASIVWLYATCAVDPS